VDYETVTKVIILLIVVIVAVWDVFLISTGNCAATFSVVLYESSKAWPIIAFALGVLCGHVFWQIYSH
jgi:hypothetical protein